MLRGYRFEAEEHNLFRNTLRKYLQCEAVPYYENWEEEGSIPKSFWKGLGEMGFLCSQVSEDYGGIGLDFSFSVIVMEELAKVGPNLVGISMHNDIVVSFLDAYGSVEQKERWLPGCASGDFITAMAMSEYDTGSNLHILQTAAIRDEDDYIVNGHNAIVSNGQNGNLFIVVVKTDPVEEQKHRGISLLLVEEGTSGFMKVQNTGEVGFHTQDSAILTFDNCRVPAANLLGEEGQGFFYLKEKIQRLNLVLAIGAQAVGEKMLERTIDFTKSNPSNSSPQKTQLKIAEMAMKLEMGKTFLESLIEDQMAGKENVAKSSMTKYWLTQMAQSIYKESIYLNEGYENMEDDKMTIR